MKEFRDSYHSATFSPPRRTWEANFKLSARHFEFKKAFFYPQESTNRAATRGYCNTKLPHLHQALVNMVFLVSISLTLWVLGVTAVPPLPVTVAHESLVTPAPVVYNVDELQRAWPTSDAVPVGGLCECRVQFVR